MRRVRCDSSAILKYDMGSSPYVRASHIFFKKNITANAPNAQQGTTATGMGLTAGNTNYLAFDAKKGLISDKCTIIPPKICKFAHIINFLILFTQ